MIVDLCAKHDCVDLTEGQITQKNLVQFWKKSHKIKVKRHKNHKKSHQKVKLSHKNSKSLAYHTRFQPYHTRFHPYHTCFRSFPPVSQSSTLLELTQKSQKVTTKIEVLHTFFRSNLPLGFELCIFCRKIVYLIIVKFFCLAKILCTIVKKYMNIPEIIN